MSSSRLHDPGYDPGYGSIRDICRKLGYAGEVKRTRRFYYSLSGKTAEYRKQFITELASTSPNPIQFPLEYYAPEAQTCASMFLDQNRHFFEESVEGGDPSWPIYPQDREQIVSNLARLMCVQEHMRRRNTHYAESMKRKKEEDQQSRDRAEVEGGNEDTDSVSVFNGDGNMPSVAQRDAARRATIINSNISISEDDSEEPSSLSSDEGYISSAAIRGNIEIHLNFIYPLDGRKDGVHSDWLFRPGSPWPVDIQPFTFRYFHEKNLYNSRNGNKRAIHEFVGALKKQLRLDRPCTKEEEAHIFNKSQKYVSRVISKWVQDYGFVVQIRGNVKKTPQFEEAWKRQRERWICQVHDGVTENILELRQTTSSSKEASPENGLRKRPADDGPSEIHRAEGFTHSTPAKRYKSGEQIDLTLSEGLMSPNARIESASTTVGTEPDLFTNSTPRALKAVMTTATSNQGPAPPAVVDTPSTGGLSLTQNFQHVGEDSSAPPPVPESNSVNEPPSSPASAGSKLPELFERRSAPYGINGASLQGPEAFPSIPAPNSVDVPNPVTTLIQVPQPIPNQKRKKPSLQLLVERIQGALNYDDVIRTKEFQNASLPEFLNLVSSRRSIPASSIVRLRFTQHWGGRAFFVVDRYSGDDQWRKVKEEIKNNFIFARDGMPECQEFQVWVMCEVRVGWDVEEDDW